MIEVKNLTKSYGPNLAIDHLSFKINKGEVVGFLGPNGAGKSTTMKIITGFMSPSSGQALVGGIDVFENPIEVKRKIGYLPETPPVYGDMYVQDYLRFVAELKGVSAEKLASSVDYAIEKTNLQGVRKRLIQNLSKGFKQRVGIAQALVSDPEVLILDEPTVGLDPKQVAEIRDLIQELKGKHTIILSTHVLSEVQATCEKIIIINKGKIVAEDTIKNLATRRSGLLKINLKIKKLEPHLAQLLATVDGVKRVDPGESATEWKIETTLGEEMIEKLAQLVIQKQLGLLEISSEKQNLEEIFINLTYGSAAEKREKKELNL